MMYLDKYSYEFNKKCGLILRNDEDFEIYMNPRLYIQDKSHHINPIELRTIIICEIQNHLHILLEKYLNGFITPILPLRATLSLDVKHHLKNLTWFLRQLSYIDTTLIKANNLIEIFCKALSKKLLTSRDLAELIANSYIFLSDIIEKEASRNFNTVSLQGLKPYLEDNYKSEFLKPVAELQEFVKKCLKDYLVGFYIHGSLSTLDYCGYSDLDTLMIIRKSVVEDPEKLYNFQRTAFSSTRFLYMVDIFQHHGHFVITEQDLNYFPETYFPTVLFNYSTPLMEGTNKLTINERECWIEKYNTLWNMCYSFRSTYFSKSFPKNSYRLKSYLSRLMLLPALYLQCKGTGCYKKFSFAKASPDFNPEDWQIMEEVSLIRDKWDFSIKGLRIYRKLLQMGVNPFLVPRIARILSGQIPYWLQRNLDESFYKKATIFAERMNSYLLEG